MAKKHDIPVLTDMIDTANTGNEEVLPEPASALGESQMTELQTELASRSFDLTDQLLHAAFQEMEAALFEQVSNRLRKELPELIDRILRDHFEVDSD
jgi:hypothetical protein